MASPQVAAPQMRSPSQSRTGAYFASAAMAASCRPQSDSAANCAGVRQSGCVGSSSATAGVRRASSPYLPCRDSSAKRRVASDRRTGRGVAQGV